MRPASPPDHAGELWAARAFDPARGLTRGLLLTWSRGRWTRCAPAAEPPPRLPEERILREGLLTPGLLNAHVHLDYSWLRGALPAGVGFAPWLADMLEARRTLAGAADSSARGQAACRSALQAALAGGTTELWDIDSYGWGRAALQAAGVPAISFCEWICPASNDPAGPDPRERVAALLAEFDVPTPTPGTLCAGLSPHAPYSVSRAAFQALGAALAERAQRRPPLAVHVAESPDEIELLMQGSGPLAELFTRPGFAPPAVHGIRQSPIARVLGALPAPLLLIHANLPQAGDVRALARHGATVAFCPRSHVFFGYPPYPLQTYLMADVPLALGTDSLASNETLDMRAELRCVLRQHADRRWLAAREWLGLVTGARLGAGSLCGPRGAFEIGQPAQWVQWSLRTVAEPSSDDDALDALLDPATGCIASSALPRRPLD